MKLQTLQMLQILLRHVQDHGGLTAVHISKHSPSHHAKTLSRSRSIVDCANIQAFTLKLSQDYGRLPAVHVSKHSCVCNVCIVCVRGVSCMCAVWCVRVVCGVVCVLCVWRGLARGKHPVCRFKRPPCVPAKRAHVFNMHAFCRYTRRPFEPTHGKPLSFSLLSSLILSLSRRSLPSFSISVL